MKTLDNENTQQAQASSDVDVFGAPDMWVLLCKASSKKQGWMKSTKAMVTATGVVLQVATQQGEHVSEALVYIPGAKLIKDFETGHLRVA